MLNIFLEITTEPQKLTRVECLYTLHQPSSIAASYRLKTREVTLVQSMSLLRFHQLYTPVCAYSSMQFHCRYRSVSPQSGYRMVPSLERNCFVLLSLQPMHTTHTLHPHLLTPGNNASVLLHNFVFENIL